MHDHWSVADVLYLFAAVLFIAGVVLMLAVITLRCPEEDKGNGLRSNLLLTAAIALGILALVSQRYLLVDSVKHMLE